MEHSLEIFCKSAKNNFFQWRLYVVKLFSYNDETWNIEVRVAQKH